ncbi:MAG TPA: hypothetical protein VGM90_24010 [Kofleriaceae bacterium]|jgi:hypothetical protein
MRRLLLLTISLAACTPDISTGTYLCGAEESCPGGQKCDGATNLCVSAENALPFACNQDDSEVEPNDSVATAQNFVVPNCGSTVEITGCEGKDADAADYFSFMVPAQCAAQTIAVVRTSYPLAYEPPAVNLLATGGSDVLTDQPCTASATDEDGDSAACGRGPVTSGMTYTLEVTGSGEKNCGGTCAHNRYRLTVTLTQ